MHLYLKQAAEVKVFKFGGASVKDTDNIINTATILQRYGQGKCVVVISAIGKMTNALEVVYQSYLKNKSKAPKQLNVIIQDHLAIAELLGLDKKKLSRKFEKQVEANLGLINSSKDSPDKIYDHIVSLGELLSTLLISSYLKKSGRSVKWMDARKVLMTDDNHREGKVDFKVSTRRIQKKVKKLHQSCELIITQGFLGGTKAGMTTTLGREGSDYTAAIMAYALGVKELTIWKDVPGILTADPRRFKEVTLLKKLSYREAIEMTYYGAKVIHPKTIQPIQNKGIKLKVKSFKNPKAAGTTISSRGSVQYPPIVVIQDNVILLQISSKDFSFISEDHLSFIFEKMKTHKIKLGVMRNSAISFTLVILDVDSKVLKAFVQDISSLLTVEVHAGLQMMTVRHFVERELGLLTEGKEILFEETLDDTVTMVLRG